ncbi:MAG TPA: glycosyltransferase [Pyrinomonadaceae bacterium]|nr:glycosyltransferase [Pyrinomonadaceae bacterium]
MKPNVLILIGSFDQGGSERQAVQLVRLLHESGRVRVHVACLQATGVLRAEVDGLNLGDIPAFPLTSFYDRNMLSQLKRFKRFLREREIDVVQSFDFYTNIFGMLGSASARTPARIAARRETDGTKTTAQKWIERRAFQLAHVIVANAEAVRRELVRDGVPAAKIVTVYNGMDLERVAPRPKLSRAEAAALFGLPVEAGRRFVTIVANMRHAMKDQPTFLRAARRVRESAPEAAFVLAGEGELVPEIRAFAAELGLADDAFFIGRCAQVSELLNISDVCVLSSKGVEGFSNSITEYMAAARPVVATDIGGAREAIVEGETGYIVAPGDDAAMAERIAGLLADPARAARMGERGRRVVEEKFSCEVQLERIERLYEQLLHARRAGTRLAERAAARGTERESLN